MSGSNDKSRAPVPVFFASAVRPAVIRLMLLLGLTLLVFGREAKIVFHHLYSGQSILGMALPVAAVALIWLRRKMIGTSLKNGSFAGVLVVCAGMLWHFLCTWPFDYAFLRLLALPVVVSGCIWAAAGGHVLKRSLPILMILAFSLPLGARIYAAFIVKPETITLKIARATLDQLPGVDVSLRGPDLLYTYAGREGAIALGESNRGMTMLSVYSLIGAFVVFSRVRPLWQIIVTGLAAGPIVVLANFARVLAWGVVTVYGNFSPTSAVPRNLAGAFSVLTAYLLFALCCYVLSHLLIEADNSPDEDEVTEAAHA